MNTTFNRLLVLALLVTAAFAAANTARAESAFDQLNRATDGNQHQGQTFDGSAHSTPRGGLDVPVAR